MNNKKFNSGYGYVVVKTPVLYSSVVFDSIMGRNSSEAVKEYGYRPFMPSLTKYHQDNGIATICIMIETDGTVPLEDYGNFFTWILKPDLPISELSYFYLDGDYAIGNRYLSRRLSTIGEVEFNRREEILLDNHACRDISDCFERTLTEKFRPRKRRINDAIIPLVYGQFKESKHWFSF